MVGVLLIYVARLDTIRPRGEITMAKEKFDMIAIKEKLAKEQYEKEKENGFKISKGEKIMHFIVSLAIYFIFISLMVSYQLSRVINILIVAILTLALAYRTYKITQMTTRRH